MTSFSQITSFPLILIHLHLMFFLLISITICPLPTHACHEEERRALLNFKSSLDDPSGRLSTWQDSVQHKNCCDWYGIKCSAEFNHVVSINLRNAKLEDYINEFSYSGEFHPPSTSLRGKLSPSLVSISHLEYLDLAFNDFQKSEIPFRFSELTKLIHLDLSNTNFSASISRHFTNISSLVYLDLSYDTIFDYSFASPPDDASLFHSSWLKSPSTKWMRGLVNLQVLRLSGIDLFEATSSRENFAEHISYLWNLRDLDISNCNISGSVFPIHQFHNLSRLSSLNMNRNYLDSRIPLQLTNLTSLSILELNGCNLRGSVPYLPQLEELDVSGNTDLRPDLPRMFDQRKWPKLQKLQLSATDAIGLIPSSISNAPLLEFLSVSGSFYFHQFSVTGFNPMQVSLPNSIYNLSRLQHLDLSGTEIKSPIHSSISNLSRLQHLDLSETAMTSSIHSFMSNLKNLRFLDLSSNNIIGTVPTSICQISSLQHLDLRKNNITGTVPSCITNLRNLSFFDVSENSLRGTLSLISLINELNLSYLDLNSNKLTVIIDKHLYPSKVILVHLGLQSCNLKGFIPTFICNFTHLEDLDLSVNNFRGDIPSCISNLKNLYSLDLSSNRLHGPLPLLPQGVGIINLSNNQLSGSVHSSYCVQNPGKSYTNPEKIKLFNNKLSGSIPTSIGYCSDLHYLNLANNNLTGNIPNELQNPKRLRFLYLSDNNLHGTFPMFIKKLLHLIVLTLGNNNFEGLIPAGLGSLSRLAILSLRSNRFNGSIPKDIIQLESLQILDLSFNNFSGPIPERLGNLTWLANKFWPTMDNSDVEYELTMKGATALFKQKYLYSSGIDLSSNALDGNIPEEISLLIGLQMLNLSHNLFSSRIPEHIGNMSRLESLDLSSNRLFGHIPQSLASIDSLQYLILSNNNLSGRIPRGTHFDTLSLDGSAFAGNDLLCGFPTENDCEGDHKISTGSTNTSSEVDEDDQEDGKEKFLLYAIGAMGCAVGFWGLFFVLLLKKQKWWFPYWRTINSVAVKIVECIHKKQQ
ncbi:hypothetical protein MKW92_025119 [Papaver armeniacum]|nr:hypothetical protein MKW92_025119 [Papaver armeniacum]